MPPTSDSTPDSLQSPLQLTSSLPTALPTAHQTTVHTAIQTILLSFSLFLLPTASLADGQTKEFKLPPVDTSDKSRCQIKSSAIGQANAARDKLYDLRLCDLQNSKAGGFDLSGVIMTDTDVSNSNFVETQFSKGYLHSSNFQGADFTNGIIDRASFFKSDLRQAIFHNAVLTGTSFEGADVEGADFSDAYIGDFDIRNLCKNPTLKGTNEKTGMETRVSAGCK
ncbi:hypothetical protein TrRE_jg8822 [Triparma retinervis]|jgi:uncharacterized protein YjbI with pentapeptide repeats|uniref:Pentapeptide repeat-containing protein n=1 Tax=Triparma retinervis TaxID=2557542 RepID=A0A9W7E6I1_9STRA|nr:hypothetical protein TrRE_jg8822 [Triparma retinervis]